MTDRPVAALYLRSAAENAAAIAEQRRRCTVHAAAQGWSVGEMFVDDGVSGLNDERPGLGALRGCMRDGTGCGRHRDRSGPYFPATPTRSHVPRFCGALGVRIAYDVPTAPAAFMHGCSRGGDRAPLAVTTRRTAP